MKTETVLFAAVGIAALLLVAKKSSAAMPTLPSNVYGNMTPIPSQGSMYGGGVQPRYSQGSGNMRQQRQPQYQQPYYGQLNVANGTQSYAGLGSLVGGVLGNKSVQSGISSAIGSIGDLFGGGGDQLGNFISGLGGGSGGAADVISQASGLAEDWGGLGEIADMGLGEGGMAFDPTGGYLAAAAVASNLIGQKSISNMVTSSVNGLGDSIANIFGW